MQQVPTQEIPMQQIVVDEVFPHAPETIWKTLTDGALMALAVAADRLRAGDMFQRSIRKTT